jgi:signal-transduction protein with cAMP-binding, CBS, and nucleotidyltransferase domain
MYRVTIRLAHKVNTLDKLPAFRQLEDNVQEEIAGTMELVKFRHAQEVVTENATADRMFVMLRGVVEVMQSPATAPH